MELTILDIALAGIALFGVLALTVAAALLTLGGTGSHGFFIEMALVVVVAALGVVSLSAVGVLLYGERTAPPPGALAGKGG